MFDKVISYFHAQAKKEFTPHVYNRWIRSLNIKIHKKEEGEDAGHLDIALYTEDAYAENTLKGNYLSSIIAVFKIILSDIPFSVAIHPLQSSLNLFFADKEQINQENGDFSENIREIDFFTDQYSFDNFILGPSNQFAHAAAKAVVLDPGKCFNPLFIFGASGLGKTHLIRAIGYEMTKKETCPKILYVPCGTFINDFRHLSLVSRLDVFKNKYRGNVDVFLLDDIQLLSNKEDVQEEFFYVFNDLYERKKQIVVTSDNVPKNLTGMEDRIRTRFEWGLIADIQPPEFDTRVEIIKQKTDSFGLVLRQDVVNFIASHFTNNIRELEGVLSKLKLFSHMSNGEISLQQAQTLIKPFINFKKTSCGVDDILQVVATEFGCRVRELKSNIKTREISLPRHISMYLIRKYTEKTYPEIGCAIGGKDYTTVMHGVKKISRLICDDVQIKKRLEDIEEKLKTLSI